MDGRVVAGPQYPSGGCQVPVRPGYTELQGHPVVRQVDGQTVIPRSAHASPIGVQRGILLANQRCATGRTLLVSDTV